MVHQIGKEGRFCPKYDQESVTTLVTWSEATATRVENTLKLRCNRWGTNQIYKRLTALTPRFRVNLSERAMEAQEGMEDLNRVKSIVFVLHLHQLLSKTGKTFGRWCQEGRTACRRFDMRFLHSMATSMPFTFSIMIPCSGCAEVSICPLVVSYIRWAQSTAGIRQRKLRDFLPTLTGQQLNP